MLYKITGGFLALALTCTTTAFAWGDRGHEIVGAVAAAAFPSDMPAFTRSTAAQYEIMELGPELDRLKGAGTAWDEEEDPGHYIDLDDNDMAAGVVSLQKLPATREDYDTALRAAKSNQYDAGYLPYAILDGWEQLRYEFAYWRVDDYHATHAATDALRAEAAEERAIDQALILRDIGVWGHFVEDASQPLHTSVHFNGWGKYSNPNGYTQSRRTHSLFESAFVEKYMTPSLVAPLVQPSSLTAPSVLLKQDQVLQAIAHYIAGSVAVVPQLYQIEKDGGFANGTSQAIEFTAKQLARGAMELRDLVLWAWEDSLNERVGYPYRNVRDIINGSS